jgi:membrane associated rhomboid family serine protease
MDGYDNGQAGLKCLYALILANIAMLIVIPERSPLQDLLALSPPDFKALRLWQPVTAIFLHAGFLHLLMNMIGLYMFGQLAAPALGVKRFLGLFFVSGVAGNMLWLLFNIDGFAAIVGASGAVMGVIMAAAMIFPNQNVYFIFAPFPVKLKTMAIVFVMLELFSEFSAPPGGAPVAYLAHIGGFVGGYIYMRLFAQNMVEWDILAAFTGRKIPQGWRIVTPPRTAETDGRVTQAELDRILDKISATGVNSLSDEEMETLRRAREQMKGQR